MSQDESSPKPRKKRLARRLIILAGCLLVLFAVWGVAYLWTDSAFEREIAAIRARGEPVKLSEMAPRPLPGDRDAAVFVRQAMRIYDANVRPLLDALDAQIKAAGYATEDSGDVTWTDLAEYPTLLEEWRAQVEEIRDAARPAVELLRKARGLESYDLGLNFNDPLGTWGNVNLSKHRAMARLSRLLSAEAHHRGNDAEAIENLRDLFTISDNSAQFPTLIGELVAISVDSIAYAQCPSILPELKIGNEKGNLSRQEIQDIIGLLLDANRPRRRLIRCIMGERVIDMALIREAIAGRPQMSSYTGSPLSNSPIIMAAIRPALVSDAAKYMSNMSAWIDAAGQGDYPSAAGRLKPMPSASSKIGWLLHPFTFMMLMDGHKPLELHFRGVAGLRMAGVAMAMRLYEIDKGRRPAKLEDLVPDYLSALPKDPFDPNGSPIRMGQWGGHELLYSVNVVGKDLGGQYAQDANGPVNTAGEFNWPYFLRGDGPREKIVKNAPASAPSPGELPATAPSPGEGVLPNAPPIPEPR